MKIITAGHKYELANFENPDAPGQILQFIEKSGDPLTTVNDGTTNEEVLAMLIDRCHRLAKKLPSHETIYAIHDLESALQWFEQRTADRKRRQVEGTIKP